MSFKTTGADIKFKYQMESCKFPVSDFNHREHVRLAYIYLTANDTDSSFKLMRDTLQCFLRHHEVDSSKYHATLTKAWILAVYHFMNTSKKLRSADELIEKKTRDIINN